MGCDEVAHGYLRRRDEVFGELSYTNAPRCDSGEHRAVSCATKN